MSKSMFFSITVVLLITGSSWADYPSKKLLKAIAIKESGDNDKAIGDKGFREHAYGHLQIRRPCIDDVNKKFGTHHKAKECLGNRELSEWTCKEYINMHATSKALHKLPTDESMCRIWNGGPHGYKKTSTVKYWVKIQKILKTLG